MKKSVATNQEKAASKTVRHEKDVVVQNVQKEVKLSDSDDSSVEGDQKTTTKICMG